MTGHHFISYSSADAQEFALRLHDALEGRAGVVPWLDKRCLRIGMPWDTQIRDALRSAATVLFVMTPDSVDDLSECNNEWSAGLRYKKPVVPVLAHPDAEMPYGLGRRHYLDCSTDFARGVERLLEHLAWLHTPSGLLEEARIRLADAHRTLRRAVGEAGQQRWLQEIDTISAEIRRLEAIVRDPAAAVDRTDQRVVEAIERIRLPASARERTARSRVVNAPPYRVRHDLFHDRTEETKKVTELLRNDAVRVITVTGRGGAGKTALVCRLLELLESGHDADGVPFENIAGIVYLSALGAQHILVDKLFLDVARLLPDDVANQLRQLHRNPQVTIRDKMRALLEHFSSGCAVVLLDNFEDLVDPVTETISNPDLLEELRALLELPHHAIKVIITSRVLPVDLQRISVSRQGRIALGEGLPSPFAEDFLRKLDDDGTAGLREASAELLARAQARTRGFPKALEALFQVLAEDPSASLRGILDASATYLPDRVVEDLVGEAFSRLDASAAQVMQALAVFERPVPSVAIDYLLKSFVPTIDSAPLLGRLLKRHFVRRDEHGRFFLHPVEREYALERIPLGARSDCRLQSPPFTQCALRGLAADYFREARKRRQDWQSLEDLDPQFAEIELRVLAGDFDEAAEIACDIHYSYLYVWGCYRQMIDLHERLRDAVTDPVLKEECLRHLGIAYSEMGRVDEAIEATAESLAMARERRNVNGEILDLGNLGTDYRDLGNTERALEYYNEAWQANRAENSYFRAVHSTYLGECHAYRGDVARARDVLREGVLLSHDCADEPRESLARGLLAQVLVDLNLQAEAVNEATKALRAARSLHSPRLVHVACNALFRANLAIGDLPQARAAAEEAVTIDYPIENHLAHVFLAIAAARLGDVLAAQQALLDVLETTGKALEFNPRLFHALDSQGLSLAARQLFDGSVGAEAAVAAHRQARAINRDAGVRKRLVSLYEALSPLDPNGLLISARHAADGD